MWIGYRGKRKEKGGQLHSERKRGAAVGPQKYVPIGEDGTEGNAA